MEGQTKDVTKELQAAVDSGLRVILHPGRYEISSTVRVGTDKRDG